MLHIGFSMRVYTAYSFLLSPIGIDSIAQESDTRVIAIVSESERDFVCRKFCTFGFRTRSCLSVIDLEGR